MDPTTTGTWSKYRHYGVYFQMGNRNLRDPPPEINGTIFLIEIKKAIG